MIEACATMGERQEGNEPLEGLFLMVYFRSCLLPAKMSDPFGRGDGGVGKEEEEVWRGGGSGEVSKSDDL